MSAFGPTPPPPLCADVIYAWSLRGFHSVIKSVPRGKGVQKVPNFANQQYLNAGQWWRGVLNPKNLVEVHNGSPQEWNVNVRRGLMTTIPIRKTRGDLQRSWGSKFWITYWFLLNKRGNSAGRTKCDLILSIYYKHLCFAVSVLIAFKWLICE